MTSASPFMGRGKSRLFVFVSALALPTGARSAPGHDESRFYADLSLGPAYSRYRAVDATLDVPEHHVRESVLYGFGSGYGFELGVARLDVGLRLSHLRLDVAGSYDIDGNQDAFRANYDFLFPAATARLQTCFRSRIDAYLGLTLGAALFLSDRQGAPPDSELIPVFGTLEGGFALHVNDWLDASAGVAWLPPVDQLRMLSPQLGVRAQL